MKKIVYAIFMLMVFISCSSENVREPLSPEQNEKEGQKQEDDENFTLNTRMDIPLTEIQKSACECLNDFSFKLLNKFPYLVSNQGTYGDNPSMSPLSLYINLSLLANGTSDESRKELLSLLNPKELSETTLNEFNQYIINELKNVDISSKLCVANSVWYYPTISILDDYQAKIKSYYSAEIGVLELNNIKDAEKLNAWISQATDGYMPTLYKNGFIPEEEIVLINAVYFKGGWTWPFESAKTSKQDFRNADFSVSSIDMMNKEALMRYCEDSDIKICELPYGNQAYSMYLILPSKFEDVSFFEKLDSKSWAAYKGRMLNTKLNLSIPKFDIDYMANVEGFVKQMGVKSISHMNLENMILRNDNKKAEAGFIIDHRTKISINEKGVEAAGITISRPFSSPDPSSTESSVKYFKCDKPFMYLIEERSTGAILFAGMVTSLKE